MYEESAWYKIVVIHTYNVFHVTKASYLNLRDIEKDIVRQIHRHFLYLCDFYFIELIFDTFYIINEMKERSWCGNYNSFE